MGLISWFNEGTMDAILYFTKTEREVRDFLEAISEQLHLYGVPCTINYRNSTVETENHKIYAVSSCCGLIGALLGFRYYLSDATEEEFNKRVRFKLLLGAKELKSKNELIELLREPIF